MFDCLPQYADSKPLHIVGVQNPDDPCSDSEHIDFEDLTGGAESIEQFIKKVQLKNIDVVLTVDSCSVKREGRDLQFGVKFKAIQAIVPCEQNRNNRHIGLRLARVNQVKNNPTTTQPIANSSNAVSS